MSLRKKRCQAAFLASLMVFALVIAGFSMATPTKGDGTRFSFTLLTNQGNLARITSATIVKENLEDVGIDVNLQVVEWPTFVYENLLGQDFDAIIVGWIGGIDPDIKGLWHSEDSDIFEYNFCGYNNSEVDELLIEGRGETNITKRMEIYYEIQEIIADEAPYDFLVYPQTVVGLYKGWDGFIPGPMPNSLRSWYSIRNVSTNDGSTTMIQSSIGAPSNINPILLADSPSGDVSDCLYPSPTHFNISLLQEPFVADSWVLGGTYFEYFFNNSGLWKWTDGALVTAEDYLFTLQALKAANDVDSISQSPYSYVAEWIEDLYLVGGDPYHINITVDLSTYPGGYVPGFTDLAIDFLPEHEFNNTDDSIWSTWAEVKAGLDVDDDDWVAKGGTLSPLDGGDYWMWRWVEDSINRHPQNTGAETPVTCSYFKFSDWDVGAGELTMVKDEDFPLWDQAVDENVIQTFIYKLGGTMDEISLSLQAGEIDIQDGANYAYADELIDDPDVTVLIAEELTYTYMGMNLRREPFNDVNVRRAICWAVDKTAVFDAAYFGYGSPGNAPEYKALGAWWNPDAESYTPRNVELANQLLDDAGWPRQEEEETDWVQIGLIAGIAAAAVVAIVVLYMTKMKEAE